MSEKCQSWQTQVLSRTILLREFLPGPDWMYRPYVTVLGEVEELRPVVREYLAGMQKRCVRQGEELGEMLGECGLGEAENNGSPS